MSIEDMTASALEADLTEIQAALARTPFPAQPDDVLAALVAQRAPSRLLWRIGELPHTQSYHSLDDLCDDIAIGSGPGVPAPPGR